MIVKYGLHDILPHSLSSRRKVSTIGAAEQTI